MFSSQENEQELEVERYSANLSLFKDNPVTITVNVEECLREEYRRKKGAIKILKLPRDVFNFNALSDKLSL